MNNLVQTPITVLLIALCIACYLPEAAGMAWNDTFALYPNNNPQQHIWQYVTSLFMHGGFMHLFMNMLGLWMFGSVLERYWGSTRFLLFYFCAGIGAGIFYNLVNSYQFNELYQQFVQMGLSGTDIQDMYQKGQYLTNMGIKEEDVANLYAFYQTSVVGASGAIYGILTAYAICFPNSKLVFIFIPYPVAAKYFVPVILAIELLSGVTGFSIFGQGIAHFAHLGGAIIGLVWVLLFGREQHVPAE